MSALQSQLYKQMKRHKMIADEKDSKWYVVITELLLSTYLILMPFQRKSGGVKHLSNELMQLHKICQHLFLFESVEDKISPSGFIDDKLIRTSGKIELLHHVLPKFTPIQQLID